MKAKNMLMLGTTVAMGLLSVGGSIVTHADTTPDPNKGAGSATVTYNGNAMTPDDPTANPDFTVLIPQSYTLADANLKSPVAGELSLVNTNDYKAYTGTQKVNVTIASANSFKFANGGEYKLVGGADGKTDIDTSKTPISLDTTTSKAPVNALLTKLGSKTGATDTLNFAYTVNNK